MHPIREYRLKQPIPLSQSSIADRIGVSAQLVSRYETGQKRVTAEKAVIIEKALGIPREVLRPDIFATD